MSEPKIFARKGAKQGKPPLDSLGGVRPTQPWRAATSHLSSMEWMALFTEVEYRMGMSLRLQLEEHSPLRAHTRQTGLFWCLGMVASLPSIMALKVGWPDSWKRVSMSRSAWALKTGTEPLCLARGRGVTGAGARGAGRRTRSRVVHNGVP
jgi:hypothetical protein